MRRRQGKKAIDDLLEDIRKRYAVLEEAGKLSKRAVKAFEDRYYHALTTKVDLVRFLEAECLALEELESRADHEGESDIAEEEGEMSSQESFLDRVTRELYQRIERYPSARLPSGASFDMEKLIGMLLQFGKDYWPRVERELRNHYPLGRPEARMSIESRVLEYCIAGTSGLPRVFDRYIQAVQNGRGSECEQEEQRCLAGAARFLHTMKKEVYTLLSQAEEEESVTRLKDTEIFIVSALENFRMKDLTLL